MVYVLPRPALKLISGSFYRKAYPTYFAFVGLCALTIEYVYCPWVEGILSYRYSINNSFKDMFVNNLNQGRMLPHILPEILKKQAELAAAEDEDDEDDDE